MVEQNNEEFEVFYNDYLELANSEASFSNQCIICECSCVSNLEVARLIQESNEKIKSVDCILNDFNIGKGCGKCQEDMTLWFQKFSNNQHNMG